ncbi:MAG: hypothetical protein RMY28_034140 [Nostoc sp. ChiSLP01]|nr:hypothetical protein [Nostoc sp. CmiSLP01]MDZ8283471.1 hypothetical protein [Nostoc sp. ChiSLP01]
MIFNYNIPKSLMVLLFVLELFLLISLSLVNYNAALALLLGSIIGMVLGFFPFLKQKYKILKPQIIKKYKSTPQAKKYQILILGLSSIFIISFLNKSIITYNSKIHSTVIADSYEINFEPLNKELTSFKITEDLLLRKKDVQLSVKKGFRKQAKIPFSETDSPMNALNESYSNNQATKFKLIREINSISKGFVVKELNVIPLNSSLEGYINLKFKNGTAIKIEIGGSKESTIIVDKIPKGSFYQAKDPNNLKLSDYLDEEKVEWTASNLQQGIKFAYIIEPFNYLNGVLRPLLKISSIPEGIFTFFGVVITFIVSYRFKPIVNVKAIAQAEGILMAESSKYDMRGANFQGGFAETNYGKMIENQHNNYGSRTNLVEAAAEIQQLLKQLEKTNSINNDTERMIVAVKAAEQIKNNPKLKARVINALKSGGKEAFKEAVDNPLINILLAIIEGWQEVE